MVHKITSYVRELWIHPDSNGFKSSQDID